MWSHSILSKPAVKGRDPEHQSSWTVSNYCTAAYPLNTLQFTSFSPSKRLHCTSGSVLVELLFHISLLSMHHVGTADEDRCLLECNSVLSWWLNLLWAVDLCTEWLVWVRSYSWQHSSLLIPHLQCPLLPCPLLASWTPAKLEEMNNCFTVLLVLCISTKLLSKSDPTIYTYNDSKDLSYSQTTFQHVSVVVTTIIRAVHLYTPKHRYHKLSILCTHSQSHLAYPLTQSWLNMGMQHSWSSKASRVLQEWQLCKPHILWQV